MSQLIPEQYRQPTTSLPFSLHQSLSRIIYPSTSVNRDRKQPYPIPILYISKKLISKPLSFSIYTRYQLAFQLSIPYKIISLRGAYCQIQIIPRRETLNAANKKQSISNMYIQKLVFVYICICNSLLYI